MSLFLPGPVTHLKNHCILLVFSDKLQFRTGENRDLITGLLRSGWDHVTYYDHLLISSWLGQNLGYITLSSEPYLRHQKLNLKLPCGHVSQRKT